MTDAPQADQPTTSETGPAVPEGTVPPGKPKSHTKLIVLIVVAVIVAGGVGVGVYSLLHAAGDASAKKAFIQQGADQARGAFTLPYQVDEVTVLDDIAAESDAIHYHYTLTGVDPAAIDEDVLSGIVLPTLCSTEETRNVLEHDVAMKYSYLVSETGDAYDLVFTKDDC